MHFLENACCNFSVHSRGTSLTWSQGESPTKPPLRPYSLRPLPCLELRLSRAVLKPALAAFQYLHRFRSLREECQKKIRGGEFEPLCQAGPFFGTRSARLRFVRSENL